MPVPGPLELVIILVIALLILGPGRLPDVGSALGKGLREFRKASSDIQESVRVDTTPLPPDRPADASAPTPVVPPPIVPGPLSPPAGPAPMDPSSPVTAAPVASESAPTAAPPGEVSGAPSTEATTTQQPGSEPKS
jgi:sec-independent protein translocase protein TatA